MSRDKLFMESTEIESLTTAGQVISLLVQSGARHINQEFDENQKLVGVAFTLEVLPGMIRFYKLPVKSEPVFQILNGGRKNYSERAKNVAKDKLQADRVAWRQLYRWIQAQLAMIQVGMVEAAEIFLPYMEDESGETLYQRFICDAQKLLPAASSEAHNGAH